MSRSQNVESLTQRLLLGLLRPRVARNSRRVTPLLPAAQPAAPFGLCVPVLLLRLGRVRPDSLADAGRVGLRAVCCVELAVLVSQGLGRVEWHFRVGQPGALVCALLADAPGQVQQGSGIGESVNYSMEMILEPKKKC